MSPSEKALVIEASGVETLTDPLGEAERILRGADALGLTLRALGMLQPVPGENFCLTGLPLTIDGVRPALRSAAPLLGADNARHGLPECGPSSNQQGD